MKINFNEKYFKTETICNFTVEEKMKRAWAAYQDLLLDFDYILKKHNIRYFADYGTLLGAVRHKGFIPWDDDIDICMFRSDFEKLASIMKTELLPGFRFGSRYNDKFIHNMSGYFQNSTCISYSNERLDRYYGCPYVITIDIFPLDNVADNIDERNQITPLFNAVYDLAHKYNDYCKDGTAEEYIRQIEDICSFSIDRDNDIEGQLWYLADSISMLCNDSPTKNVAYMPDLITHHNMGLREAKWYEDVVYLPFEKITVPVPFMYHETLECLFGKDYMTPVLFSAGHDYPFYKKQDLQYSKMIFS